jgi:hypothetical protein
MDLLYIGLIVGFFALTWGLTALSDALAAPAARPGQEQVR